MTRAIPMALLKYSVPVLVISMFSPEVCAQYSSGSTEGPEPSSPPAGQAAPAQPPSQSPPYQGGYQAPTSPYGAVPAREPAPYTANTTTQPYQGPAMLPPAERPGPELLGTPYARRPIELQLRLQSTYQLCPTWAPLCSNDVGFGSAFTFVHRPDPHMTWGIEATVTQFTENLEDSADIAKLEHTTVGGNIFGRIYFFKEGAWDPYVQMGFGGGSFGTAGTVTNASSGEVERYSGRHFVPLLNVQLGVEAHVSKTFRIGGVFSWTQWLLSPVEQCGEKLLGMCSYAGGGHFDVNNANWGLGVNGTVVFGNPL